MKLNMTEAEFREKYVKLLLTQKGVTEHPAGTNSNKFAAKLAPWVNRQPWCGVFVSWAFYVLTGIKPQRTFNSFYTPSIVAYAKKIGAWKTSAPKRGDWCLMNFPGGNFVDHVGATISGRQNIEGNTSGGPGGSQANGGGVFVRTRPSSVIAGWVDLGILARSLGVEFKVEEITPGKGLDVDGQAGPQTVKALQKMLNVARIGRARRGKSVRHWPVCTVDGEVGGQTVQALQCWTGASPDGEDGPETAKKLAATLKATAPTNRVFGNRPLIRALQVYLNKLK